MVFIGAIYVHDDIIRVIRTRTMLVARLISDATKAEKTVLLYLADRGKGTRYDVAKEKKISYSVVHDAFKRLCKRGWIWRVRDEKSERNVPRTVYMPTEKGVLCALLEQPENSNIFKRLAEHIWILKKGEIFKRHGTGEIMAEIFLRSSADFLEWADEEGLRNLGGIEEFMEGLIPEFLLESKDKDVLKFSRAMAEDSDLQKFFFPVVRSYREKYHREYLKKSKLMDKVLNIPTQSRSSKLRGGEKLEKRPHR